MHPVRNEAFKLRKRGLSYNEINKRLGIPKATLSDWFSKMVLSKKARARLEVRKRKGTEILIKRNKAQTERAKNRALSIRKESADDISVPLSGKELLLVGVALYWGEGYKRPKYRNGRELYNHPIQLTNSDPILARAFVRFLNEVMDVPLTKIKLTLRLYDHINEKTALQYWLKATRLPTTCYMGTTKLVSVASLRKKPYNSLPFGTAEIRINDTQLFHRLMGWLEGLKTRLAS